jgi:magnesium transporter
MAEAAASTPEPSPHGDQVVACVAYAGGKRIGNVDIDDISEILRFEGQFIWIGLYEPGDALLRKIQEEFNLHELAVEDALAAHQRPKLEEYGDSLFVVLRTARLLEQKIEFGETHIFVGRRYVVTIRHGASNPYTPVRIRLESSPEHLRQGPGFVLYAVMDYVVDQYFPIIGQLEDMLEEIEEVIFGGTFTRDTTERIYDFKRELVRLKRSVSPLVDVCNRLIRFDSTLITPETQPYFRDVYDHAVRINESIDLLREILGTALEAHFSLISVSQNEITKKLAAWAAIIAVPTMVAGVYGMNFEHMPELQWRYGYFLALGGMLGICTGLYAWFRRAGWL